MARVTVEDCVERIPNRFELVLAAGQRARDISAGAPLTVDRDNDKNPVVALREIADATVDVDELKEAVVQGLQKHVEIDEPEEDDFDAMAIDREIAQQVGPADEGAEVAEDALTVQDADGDADDDMDFGDNIDEGMDDGAGDHPADDVDPA